MRKKRYPKSGPQSQVLIDARSDLDDNPSPFEPRHPSARADRGRPTKRRGPHDAEQIARMDRRERNLDPNLVRPECLGRALFKSKLFGGIPEPAVDDFSHAHPSDQVAGRRVARRASTNSEKHQRYARPD